MTNSAMDDRFLLSLLSLLLLLLLTTSPLPPLGLPVRRCRALSKPRLN